MLALSLSEQFLLYHVIKTYYQQDDNENGTRKSNFVSVSVNKDKKKKPFNCFFITVNTKHNELWQACLGSLKSKTIFTGVKFIDFMLGFSSSLFFFVGAIVPLSCH